MPTEAVEEEEEEEEQGWKTGDRKDVEQLEQAGAKGQWLKGLWAD